MTPGCIRWLLVALCVVCVSTGYQRQCWFGLQLRSASPDGWGGASISVYANDTASPWGERTMTGSGESVVYAWVLNHGAELSYYFISGSHDANVAFDILDNHNAVVYTASGGTAVEGWNDLGRAYCQGAPDVCYNEVELEGDTDDSNNWYVEMSLDGGAPFRFTYQQNSAMGFQITSGQSLTVDYRSVRDTAYSRTFSIRDAFSKSYLHGGNPPYPSTSLVAMCGGSPTAPWTSMELMVNSRSFEKFGPEAYADAMASMLFETPAQFQLISTGSGSDTTVLFYNVTGSDAPNGRSAAQMMTRLGEIITGGCDSFQSLGVLEMFWNGNAYPVSADDDSAVTDWVRLALLVGAAAVAVVFAAMFAKWLWRRYCSGGDRTAALSTAASGRFAGGTASYSHINDDQPGMLVAPSAPYSGQQTSDA